MDDLFSFNEAQAKPSEKLYRWVEATKEDSEEYKWDFGDLEMKLICYPRAGLDIYSKAEIFDFKTKEWFLLSELSEKEKE